MHFEAKQRRLSQGQIYEACIRGAVHANVEPVTYSVNIAMLLERVSLINVPVYEVWV